MRLVQSSAHVCPCGVWSASRGWSSPLDGESKLSEHLTAPGLPAWKSVEARRWPGRGDLRSSAQDRAAIQARPCLSGAAGVFSVIRWVRWLAMARAPGGKAGADSPSVHRDPRRLVAFSDAVFAISITLLVLGRSSELRLRTPASMAGSSSRLRRTRVRRRGGHRAKSWFERGA